MEQEHPFYFNINPVCSIWPAPLLKPLYNLSDTVWKIEQKCEKRYMISFVDQKAAGVMPSFSGNHTAQPTNMQIETVSLYCIFVVSFLYLWLTMYAIRQVFGIVCTKAKESLSSKSVWQRPKASTSFILSQYSLGLSLSIRVRIWKERI